MYIILLTLSPNNTYAGTWTKSDGKDTFYVGNDGNAKYGWFKDDEYNQWHYCSKWAGVHTGWFYDRDYNTYYHWDAMGRYDGSTKYLEQTDESIHDGWCKIEENYCDSVVFFCQYVTTGKTTKLPEGMWNIYYPLSTCQSEFLKGNVSYIYLYNTSTHELIKKSTTNV